MSVAKKPIKLTKDEIELIEGLAKEQAVSVHQFIIEAAKISSFVHKEKNDGGRILVERKNKKLYEFSLG
jgi:hypothetical protein